MGVRVYGEITHVHVAGQMTQEATEQMEIVITAEALIKHEDLVVEKAKNAITAAKEAIAKAELDIQGSGSNKEKAEADKVAAETAKKQAEVAIEAAENELKQIRAWIPANGACVPSGHSYGGLWRRIRPEQSGDWYFHTVGCDEDVLDRQMGYFWKKSKGELEDIINRGCTGTDSTSPRGCQIMAGYSLDARNTEEKYAKCEEGKRIIPGKETTISSLKIAKQGAVKIIENAVKIIEEAIKNIELAKTAKENYLANIKDEEEVIRLANTSIEEARKRIEVAENILKGTRGEEKKEL